MSAIQCRHEEEEEEENPGKRMLPAKRRRRRRIAVYAPTLGQVMFFLLLLLAASAHPHPEALFHRSGDFGPARIRYRRRPERSLLTETTAEIQNKSGAPPQERTETDYVVQSNWVDRKLGCVG